jgi:hypothetical protein
MTDTTARKISHAQWLVDVAKDEDDHQSPPAMRAGWLEQAAKLLTQAAAELREQVKEMNNVVQR